MRKGMQKDFGLIDLPFPARVMSLTPLGTLKVRSEGDGYSFEVRRGVDVFPSVGDPVLLPGAEQLSAIVEGRSWSVPADPDRTLPDGRARAGTR